MTGNSKHSPNPTTPTDGPSVFDPQVRPLPSFEFEGIHLSALLTPAQDLSLLLEIQDPPAVPSIMYPLASYAKIAEFRAMLAHPLVTQAGNNWSGSYFLAFAMGPGPDRYYWTLNGPAITICVTSTQWVHIRGLFDTAFASPEYARAWTRLAAQHG